MKMNVRNLYAKTGELEDIYELVPPEGDKTPPVEFRVARATALDTDVYTFARNNLNEVRLNLSQYLFLCFDRTNSLGRTQA